MAEPSGAVPEDFRVRLYPDAGRSMPVGDCVRGWIVFEVPRTQRPSRIIYTPEGLETPAPPLRWRIG